MTSLTHSVAEAAELLGISRPQARRLVDKGVLPRVPHLGRVVRIPRIAIDALVASAMPSSASPPPTRVPADDGIGATTSGRVGKSSPPRRSTSEKASA